MLESTDYLAAMKRAPTTESRQRLAKLYRIAKARESTRRCLLPSDTLWSSRGDVQALTGESSPITPTESWERLERDGAILVDSAILGERVVVTWDESTTIPERYMAYAAWSLPELRRIRDAVRGGAFKLQAFESINRAKRMLGGTLVTTSNPLLSGEIVGVQDPGPPLPSPCLASSHSRHCTGTIRAGEFTALLAEDDPSGDGGPVEVCSPCSVQYPWTDGAIYQRRMWARNHGVQV